MTTAKGVETGRAKKLLFVINNPDFFLSHRLPIAEAARRAGLAVEIAAPERPSAETIRQLGFRFHPLPLTRSSAAPLSEARALLALVRLFRRERPDIVHLVTIKPVIYGSLAAQVARVPRVVGALSGLGYVFIAQGAAASVRRRLVEVAYRLAFGHRNKRVIFQNPDDRAQFVARKLLDERDTVLIRGSGVDLSQFKGTPEPDAHPPVVLFASRLLLDKGVAEFAEASRLLRGRGVKARFVLVGDLDPGNPTSLPRKQLHGWLAEGLVEWWGHRSGAEMPAVFAQSHIVCLPSYREGLPKVLIEAAAAGRPIVTSDVPGCREVVAHGDNGLLAPARDARALADAIERLVKDPALRRRMGQRGRQRAESEFSIERVIAQTLALYDGNE